VHEGGGVPAKDFGPADREEEIEGKIIAETKKPVDP